MKEGSPQTSTKAKKLNVLAGIPAYNEARYIGSVVLQTKQYVDEVIVVDDGSTDNTARVAELAGANVIKHDQNKGYGGAIQTILGEARRRDVDVLVLLDADGQHDPNEIPALVEAITKGYDLVVGSRENQKEKTPTYRRIGQRVLSRSTRIASGQQVVSDSECGFRAFSRKAIAELDLKEKGMAISAETVIRAADKNLKITEVPISNIYTVDGSTLNPVRHGISVLNRILVMISERRPLFFFGVVGSILLVAGLIAGIRVLNIARSTGLLALGTTVLTALLIIAGILSIFTGIILNALIRRR